MPISSNVPDAFTDLVFGSALGYFRGAVQILTGGSVRVRFGTGGGAR